MPEAAAAPKVPVVPEGEGVCGGGMGGAACPAETPVYFKLFYSTQFVSMAGLTVIFMHRPSNVPDVLHNIMAFEERIISQFIRCISIKNNRAYCKASASARAPSGDAVTTLTYKSFIHYVHRIIAEERCNVPTHFIIRVNGIYHNTHTNHLSLSYRIY